MVAGAAGGVFDFEVFGFADACGCGQSCLQGRERACEGGDRVDDVERVQQECDEVDTASSPSETRPAPRPRMTMIASCIPPPATVHASAEYHTERTE